MIHLSAEEVSYNLEQTAKYMKRLAPMGQWIEMEIGVEDGVNNESTDNESLYTQLETVLEIYQLLLLIGPYFSIAAEFWSARGLRTGQC